MLSGKSERRRLPKNRRRSILGYGSIVVTSVLLGVFPSLSKPVMTTIRPVFFTATVSLAPFVIFTPLFLNGRRTKKELRRPVGRRLFGVIVVSTTVGGIIGPIAYFTGLQTAPASDASLLANGEMVFTIVFATFFFKEKMNRAGLIAVILVTLGVVVIASNLSSSRFSIQFYRERSPSDPFVEFCLGDG